MKSIRIANIKPNDIVDGEGVCVGVYLQGCPHHCPGCHNPETWDFNKGTLYYKENIIQHILYLISKNNVNRNLSILGGEPLCEQNIDFVRDLTAAAKKKYPNITIYCWTGYVLEQLNKEDLQNIDILIDGPFNIKTRDITLKWRGSPNQRILYKGKDF